MESRSIRTASGGTRHYVSVEGTDIGWVEKMSNGRCRVVSTHSGIPMIISVTRKVADGKEDLYQDYLEKVGSIR